jgi:hypothetical protein
MHRQNLPRQRRSKSTICYERLLMLPRRSSDRRRHLSDLRFFSRIFRRWTIFNNVVATVIRSPQNNVVDLGSALFLYLFCLLFFLSLLSLLYTDLIVSSVPIIPTRFLFGHNLASNRKNVHLSIAVLLVFLAVSPDPRLDARERLFDWVEVWGIRRQKLDTHVVELSQLGDEISVVVNSAVVHDDDAVLPREFVHMWELQANREKSQCE